MMTRDDVDGIVNDFLADLPRVEQRAAVRALLTNDAEQRAEIERLQAELEQAKQREARLVSLLQRARTIIRIDASLYTIW